MENSLSEMFYDYGKSITKHTTWIHLKNVLPADYNEIHLLWALLFLKCYNTDHVNHSIASCDEKTFRKRVWVVIEKLAFINVIEWEDRKLGAAVGQTTYTSLDGVDFKINEPKPFDPKWFSNKLKHAGLRYEIGLSLRKGDIVWAYGGYPCGDWPDLKIAKELFFQFLDANERSMGDKGYNDKKYFLLLTNRNARRHKFIMSRHETVNKRLKQFRVLSEAIGMTYPLINFVSTRL